MFDRVIYYCDDWQCLELLFPLELHFEHGVVQNLTGRDFVNSSLDRVSFECNSYSFYATSSEIENGWTEFRKKQYE